MATTMQRTRRQATPERWQTALGRAFAEGVQVRQLAGSGAWMALSGTDATVAYLTDGMNCECQAAEFGDPVCKHRAAYWNAIGALDLDPQPDPPTAPAVVVKAVIIKPATCQWCEGEGYIYKASTINEGQTYRSPCPCRPRFTPPALRPAA